MSGWKVLDGFKQVLRNITGSNTARVAVEVENEETNPIPVELDASRNPTISEITIGSSESGDKKSHTFQDGVKQFIMKAKEEKAIILEYNYDETEYDAGTRSTTYEGQPLYRKGLKVDGLEIFFNCDKNNTTIIIEEWS